ncbi:MAG: hypothetical protein K9K86_01990 [Pseudomonadales bacterium]|nr:hypothetical protein [Pseudomonadales bacterium]
MIIKQLLNRRISRVYLLLLTGFVGHSHAMLDSWDGTLPTAGDPLTSLEFQDFTVYSLNYLTNLAEQIDSGGDVLGTGITVQSYNVQSSPGQLHDELVVITGNTGQVDNNQDVCAPNSCDDAYPYPPPTGNFMTTGSSAENGPIVTGLSAGETDGVSSWSASQAALSSFLGDGNLTFLFNLNEDNGGDPNLLNGQSLLVSAKVDLIGTDGSSLLTSFYLGCYNGVCGAGTAEAAYLASGEPEADPTNIGAGNEAAGSEGDELYNPNLAPGGNASLDPRWAFVHGAISVDTTTGAFLAFGDCSFTGLSNCTTINQNLGADEVAFAAINLELSNAIKSGDWMGSAVGFMNVNVAITGQTNGFEQLFITATGGSDICCEVPEPNVIAIFSFGLFILGICTARTRRSRFIS